MHIAKIKWYIPLKVEGNPCRPEENFSMPVFFKDKNGQWMKNAWSVVLNKINHDFENSETISEIKFLFPEAPANLLMKDSKFMFFLKEVIAEGEVIS